MKKKQVEVIADTLRQNAGSEACYECLGSATIVSRCALQLINNPFFVRRRGRCKICGSPQTKFLVGYKGPPPKAPDLGRQPNDIHERRSCAERA